MAVWEIIGIAFAVAVTAITGLIVVIAAHGFLPDTWGDRVQVLLLQYLRVRGGAEVVLATTQRQRWLELYYHPTAEEPSMSTAERVRLAMLVAGDDPQPAALAARIDDAAARHDAELERLDAWACRAASVDTLLRGWGLVVSLSWLRLATSGLLTYGQPAYARLLSRAATHLSRHSVVLGALALIAWTIIGAPLRDRVPGGWVAYVGFFTALAAASGIGIALLHEARRLWELTVGGASTRQRRVMLAILVIAWIIAVGLQQDWLRTAQARMTALTLDLSAHATEVAGAVLMAAGSGWLAIRSLRSARRAPRLLDRIALGCVAVVLILMGLLFAGFPFREATPDFWATALPVVGGIVMLALLLGGIAECVAAALTLRKQLAHLRAEGIRVPRKLFRPWIVPLTWAAAAGGPWLLSSIPMDEINPVTISVLALSVLLPLLATVCLPVQAVAFLRWRRRVRLAYEATLHTPAVTNPPEPAPVTSVPRHARTPTDDEAT